MSHQTCHQCIIVIATIIAIIAIIVIISAITVMLALILVTFTNCMLSMGTIKYVAIIIWLAVILVMFCHHYQHDPWSLKAKIKKAKSQSLCLHVNNLFIT